MSPTEIMEAEHRLIEIVVGALGDAAASLEQGERIDATLVSKAVEFLRVYADQLHHGKEEALFFPLLVKRGVPPQGCPIGGLNHEHEKGRALVKALAEQGPAYERGEAGGAEALCASLRAIHDLYLNHIWKEDAMVFPMANNVMTEADQKELAGKFAGVDRSIGPEVIARLEKFARSIARKRAAPAARASAHAGCACGCGS